MKRIKKPISKELPPVKLYLDDLKHIYEILKERVKSIEITTEDYEVEDINQLKNLEIKKLHRLSIECSNPYITIEFHPSSASIYFAEDSTYNRGILSEIEDIISKRKVFLGRFLTSFWANFLIGGLIGGSFIGMLVMPKTYAWLFLALELIFILSMIFLWRFAFRSYSTIILLERKEESSFWKRNRDQIFIVIIGAIAGSLVTIFALWILNLL
jgi:hypothetical protein